MNHWRRHVILYKIIRMVLYPFTGLIYGLKSEKAPYIKEPCIILSNHTMDTDPLLLSRSFPNHLYFLASEHVFSWGWKSRIIEWVADPISKMKGDTDVSAVKELMRRIKNGHDICIFPEGNRSFTGTTKPIVPATGKLVKACRTTLVTYRFEGGYFTSPRWAAKGRRGKMKGYVVGVYPYGDIEPLTDLEINQLIERDIHEDAYLRQQEAPIAFKGNRLAEWLEVSLYICPLCESIGTLKSKGDDFYCSNCDMCSSIDEYGFIHGAGLPFNTLVEWDSWQGDKMEELSSTIGQEMAFSDEGETLFLIDKFSHIRKEVAHGNLEMYSNRILMGNKEFLFEDIRDLNVHGKQTLIFSAQGDNYEIISKTPRSARKYVSFFQYITGRGDIRRI